MSWGTVAAFADNEVVTHTKMNQLCSNIDYLRNANKATTFLGLGPELTTTSTTFVSMGANFEKLNFSSTGRPLLVLLQGSVRVTGAGTENGRFDIEVDGTRIGGTTAGLVTVGRQAFAGSVVAVTPYLASIGAIITGLSVATHNIKMMWNVDSGGTLRIGYGNAAIRFYVKEL